MNVSTHEVYHFKSVELVFITLTPHCPPLDLLSLSLFWQQSSPPHLPPPPLIKIVITTTFISFYTKGFSQLEIEGADKATRILVQVNLAGHYHA